MKAKNSIRKRLTLSLVILSVTPMLLLGTILTYKNYVVQQKQAEAIQRESSKRALGKIEAIIGELTSELLLITMTNTLMDLTYMQQHTILSIIRSHKTKTGKEIMNEIALLDITGQEKARISRSAVITPDDLTSKADSAEFLTPSTSGQVYFGPVEFNMETSEPYMIISLPVTNIGNNKTEGVLTANVRLKFMWDMIAEVPIGKSGVAYLADSLGRVIVHPNPSVVLRGSYVTVPVTPGVRTGLSGNKVVSACEQMHIGSQTLHIITEIPVSEALEQTYIFTATIASFLLLTLGGILAFGFVIVRKIVQPIELLSKTAGAISSGDLTQKAPVSGSDEVGILGESFNTMTSKLIETIESVQESHERLVLVLDSLDSVVYVSDLKTNRILFINKYTRDVFGDIEGQICWEGLQSAQSGPCEFCSNDKLLTSEGTPAAIYEWEFQNTMNNKWYFIQDRAIHWVDGSLVRLEIATDITDRKQRETDLLHRDNILKTIHFATEQLLRTPQWSDSIQNIIGSLGKTTDVSRVYIFRNHTRDYETLLCSQMYEWTAPGESPQIDLPELQDFDLKVNGFSRWMEYLSKGEPVYGHVRNSPESERTLLNAQSILSIAIVPIFSENQWWGFIGFDECRREREWNSLEIETLKTTADALGVAIHRNQAEAKIRLAYEQWQKTFDSIPHMVSIHSRDFKLMRVNRAFSDILGKSKDDLIGKSCHEVLHGKGEPLPNCPLHHTITTGESAVIEFYEPHINKWLQVSTSPVLDELKRVSAVVHIGEDITERKLAEEELLKEKQRLEEVTSYINCGLFLLDSETKVTYANSVAQEWFGPFDRMKGEYCWKVFKIENPEEECSGLKVLKTGKPSQSESIITMENGEQKVLFEIASPVKDKEGKIYQITALIIDITERKKAEEKISVSLHEKEILLKEIHHRVKNNMQVISSLLNLQSEYVDDKKYIDMFHDSRNRIRSMALVHEKLYQSNDLNNINFNDYIRSLINGLISFYGINPNNILTKIDMAEINLSIDTAIPCGLIINELLSNALKYAFTDGMRGVVEVILNKADINGEAGYELVVSDNGKGIPEDMDIRKTRSLGLQLVFNLVEHQLQGKIELIRKNGTTYKIRFRELRYSSRI